MHMMDSYGEFIGVSIFLFLIGAYQLGTSVVVYNYAEECQCKDKDKQ